MAFLFLFAGLLLLSVLIAWYSYRTAFYSPEKRKEDYYAIPKVSSTKKSGSECCRSSGRWMKSLMKL